MTYHGRRWWEFVDCHQPHLLTFCWTPERQCSTHDHRSWGCRIAYHWVYKGGHTSHNISSQKSRKTPKRLSPSWGSNSSCQQMTSQSTFGVHWLGAQPMIWNNFLKNHNIANQKPKEKYNIRNVMILASESLGPVWVTLSAEGSGNLTCTLSTEGYHFLN